MGISKQEALDLFNSDDLIGIGMAANEVRRKKTDPRVATYQIDRNINYTNFCTEYCSFCAFYRPLGAKDGYILPLEDHLREDRRDARAGRHGRAAAGRAAPGSADRVLREHAALDQASDSRRSICTAFPRRRSSASPKFPDLTRARYDRAAARRRPGFDSRRRRGNSGRRNSRSASRA